MYVEEIEKRQEGDTRDELRGRDGRDEGHSFEGSYTERVPVHSGVLVCGDGDSDRLTFEAISVLKYMGVNVIGSLDGGWNRWKEEGEVESSFNEYRPDEIDKMGMRWATAMSTSSIPSSLSSLSSLSSSSSSVTVNSAEPPRQRIVVVDVRTEHEWLGGVIPGASLLPCTEVTARRLLQLGGVEDNDDGENCEQRGVGAGGGGAGLKDHTHFIFVCASGFRSVIAASVAKRELSQLCSSSSSSRYSVSHIGGGMAAWHEAGLEVVLPGGEAEW